MQTSARQSRTAAYRAGADRRDPPYSVFLLTYLLLWVLFLSGLYALGYAWPTHVSGLDLLLLCLTTYRLTEVVTEEKVARCIRAPFCECIQIVDPDGTEREEEVPIGEGLRRVAGEFVLCPWCTGIWIATLLTFFWVLAPGVARLPMVAFAAAAGGMIFQMFAKLMDRTRHALPPE
jgi:membrane associated rhomboid family serine protease